MNELWWYRSREEALNAVSFEPRDLLGLHERLLGKAAVSCVLRGLDDGLIDVDMMSPTFLRNLSLPGAKVAVSMLGTVGDSGMHRNNNMTRLLVKGTSRERLVFPETGYRTRLNTREIIRAPRQLTIMDGAFCMSMSLGLDNSSLLPPFMPVQRDEDGVFQAVMQTCFPGAYSGYLPYLVQHSPPTQRSHTTRITEQTFSKPVLRTNDIIKALILRYGASIHGCDPEQNLRLLGGQLSSLGAVGRQRFEDVVRPVVTETVASQITEVQRFLQDQEGKPAWWANDIQRYIAALQAWIVGQQLLVPADLTGNGTERVVILQHLIERLGHLFSAWPKIVRAVREAELSRATKEC